MEQFFLRKVANSPSSPATALSLILDELLRNLEALSNAYMRHCMVELA